MERLTYKNYIEEYEVNFEKNSEKQWSIAESDTHIKVTGQPIDRLAEFEDFMEEQKVESLEHLAYYLKTLKKARKVNGELNVECCKQKKENQALKDRWQQLKEWVYKQSKPIDDIVISDDETKYIYMSDIFDEMQKLEKEIK